MRDAPHLHSAARLGRESIESIELNEPELGNPAVAPALSRRRGWIGVHQMITMKTLGLAVGIAFAASSFAVAQQGNLRTTRLQAAAVERIKPLQKPVARPTRRRS